MDREFDVLIYGASGFTGREVALAQAQWMLRENTHKQFAVGGRNAARLEIVRDRVLNQCPGVQPPEIVIADALHDDRATLASTFSRARVVINCAGPFNLVGKSVVAACIDAGADYVDISGETYFILSCMLEEHERAKSKGVFVISACGFDSIPAEIGCLHAANLLHSAVADTMSSEELERQETHIESFMRIRKRKAMTVAHVTTLESALIAYKHANKTRLVRAKLPVATNRVGHARKPAIDKSARKGIFRDARARSEADGNAPFVTLFPGSDSTVVRQSLRLVALGDSKIPDHNQFHSYAAYFVIGGRWQVLQFLFYVALLFLLNTTSFGRNLVLQHPGFFTNGLFSRNGPSEQDRNECRVSIDFFSRRLVNGVERARAVSRVSVRDFGYGATAKMVVCAAHTVLEERHKMPSGGVLSPGAAFAGTNLIERLSLAEAMRFDALHSVRC